MFKSNASAACICGVRSFFASSSIRAFSSALYGRPGEGSSGSFSALSRRSVARTKTPCSPQRLSNNCTSSLMLFGPAFSSQNPIKSQNPVTPGAVGGKQ